MRHLTANEITVQDYAWPLLHTLFSEVFPKNDWMILFDHVFFNQPGFLLYVVAAYILTGIFPARSFIFSLWYILYFYKPTVFRKSGQKSKMTFSSWSVDVNVGSIGFSIFLSSSKSYPSSCSYPRNKTINSKYSKRTRLETTCQKI